MRVKGGSPSAPLVEGLPLPTAGARSVVGSPRGAAAGGRWDCSSATAETVRLVRILRIIAVSTRVLMGASGSAGRSGDGRQRFCCAQDQPQRRVDQEVAAAGDLAELQSRRRLR